MSLDAALFFVSGDTAGAVLAAELPLGDVLDDAFGVVRFGSSAGLAVVLTRLGSPVGVVEEGAVWVFDSGFVAELAGLVQPERRSVLWEQLNSFPEAGFFVSEREGWDGEDLVADREEILDGIAGVLSGCDVGVTWAVFVIRD